MNYEEKYKQALGWMRSLYKGLHGATKEDAEHYFPELKEDEDEKIRKRLIKTFGSMVKEQWGGIAIEDILAWLEKQGGKKTLNADEVIAWLVGNIIDFEDYVRAFKKDFGL